MTFTQIAFLALALAQPCFAEWTRSVDCAAGRVYRDVRIDAGRDEFCELHLPGSLWVRDGPARFWYSEGHFGAAGTYSEGRKVGRWRECDRFDRCREQTYPRAVNPAIPVKYIRGKYVFDFRSCWSTWITRQTPESFLELNIVSGLIRCQVTYMPSTGTDRATGGPGTYLCEVPYAVGVREFDSLDLRTELPRAGLPQFCREDEPSGNLSMPDGSPAQAVAIWANTRFFDSRAQRQTRVWETLANRVDVECAALTPERLTLRLNEYAERLVLDHMGKDEIRGDACGGRFPFSPMKTVRDAAGRTLFTFGLSRNPKTAEHQRACITSELEVKPSCAAR